MSTDHISTGTTRRIEYVPLATLEPAARNPKKHDTAGIRRSIGKFGFTEAPLLDERTGRLVAGHGRVNDLTERQQLGADPPDGVKLADDGTWLVPVIRGWSSRSDEEAEAYVLAANKIAGNGGWDEEALTEILTDLAELDADLIGDAGFSDTELAALLKGETNPWDRSTPVGERGGTPPDEFPSYDDTTIKTEHTCPACGYQWSGGK